MKKMKGQFKQAGISLLEVLLSLAIIAIILVMAIQYFSYATDSQKLNIIRNIVGADMSAVQSYGINNSSDFSDVSVQKLVENGYLSKSTKNISCDSGGTCKQTSPWGDDMTITGSSGSGNVTLAFPLAQELCNNLKDSYGASQVDCSNAAATVYLNGSMSTT